MRINLALAGALLMLLAPTLAWGQFNAPIRYNEGPGLKISDSLVFHPGVAMEGRYDSDVFYNSDDAVGAPYLRILGHLHLATLPPQRLKDAEGNQAPEKVRFRLKTAVSFREYFSEKVNMPCGKRVRLRPASTSNAR